MRKTKNLLLFLLTLSLFAMLSFLLVQEQQFKNVEQQHRIQAGIDSLKMEHIYEYVSSYGYIVPVTLQKEIIVTDSNHKQYNIEQLLKKKKYIYHFDETNCFTCVERFLPFLTKLSKKVGSSNVIILGSYEKSENLFITLKGYALQGISVYNLAPSYLKDKKLNEINVPYIFEADSTLQTNRFYIPEKALPALSELYFKNSI